MRPTVAISSLSTHLKAWLLLLMWASVSPVYAESAIPRPEGIQADVNFWLRVYSEITTNEGFLHDERNLSVIYETVKFAGGSSPRDRQRYVDDRRDQYVDALRRIIAALPTEAGRDALSADDRKILAMWGSNVSPILLKEATERVR